LKYFIPNIFCYASEFAYKFKSENVRYLSNADSYINIVSITLDFVKRYTLQNKIFIYDFVHIIIYISHLHLFYIFAPKSTLPEFSNKKEIGDKIQMTNVHSTIFPYVYV